MEKAQATHVAVTALDKYRNIIGEINYMLFLAFIAVLPYPHSISRPIWVAWLITWLLEFRFTQKPKLASFKDLKPIIPFIGFACWFIIQAVSVLYANDKQEAFSILGRTVNFVLLLPVAIWGVNERYDWKMCLKVLIATCLISIFVYVFTFFWLHNVGRAFDKRAAYDYVLSLNTITDINLHIKHRLHYTTLCCFAICGLYVLYPSLKDRYGSVRTVVYSIFILTVLSLGIYLTGSREGILNLIVIFSTMIFISVPENKKVATGLLVATLAVAGIFAMFHFHPRLKENSLKEWFTISDNPIQPSIEPRIAIWHAALEHPEEYSLHGVGAGNSAEYMIAKYKEKGWIAFEERRYHAHNEYLTQWIELGICGAVFFIAIWLSILLCYSHGNTRLALFFTEICMLNMMTDRFLGGIEGIFFCAMGLLIILLCHNRSSLTSTSSSMS